MSRPTVRGPAVAGTFYPSPPEELRALVQSLLRGATCLASPTGRRPKALIVPHAGYIYSGAVAASAYAHLAPVRGAIRRVLLLGPAHHIPVPALALSRAAFFATPLGAVEVEPDAVRSLGKLPQVEVLEAAHAPEHSLEVQLPFLQESLASFRIIPLLVGEASADQVAEVLELFWDGREMLLVVSSDLSHYRSYAEAARIDARTARAIEQLREEEIPAECACGAAAIRGLLRAARSRAVSASTADLRNSGDTAGGRESVVGYGAFLFFEEH